MSYPGYNGGNSPSGYGQNGGAGAEQYMMSGRPHQMRSPESEDSTHEDVEVVRIQAQKVADDDLRSENTLHRALNANQVTMITLGGTFGTGLLVGSGTALYEAGPVGILIAYVVVSALCYCMMTSLCEMSTYLPHKKGFVGLVSRYVHPAVGFALGWTYLCQFLFVPAAHINTAAIIMEYTGYTLDKDGNPVGNVNPVPTAAWRIIFIALVVGVNFLGIRGFGHFEFWLSTFKIFVLIALIIFGLVVDLGGAQLKNGSFQRLGFLFWGTPYGPFGHATLSGTGDLNLFLGFWSTLVRSLFSLMGIELLGVAIGEVANPRISVPKAVKQTYRLVFTLYILGVIIVGLICSSNDAAFTSSDPIISRGGMTSPFIVAANRLAAHGIVPVVSAAVVIFALSGATSNVYTGSRILYGLALDHQAPAALRKVTAAGRPLLALCASTAWCFMSFIGQNEASDVFDYFLDLTTTAGGISWICILWAHIRFRQALNVQRYPLDTLRYLAPTYPKGTWLALAGTTLIVIFKGYESYVTRGAGGLIAAYILVPWFFALMIGWKYWHGEEFTPLARIDLQEGKREIDIEEENWHIRMNTRPPLPWWSKERWGEYV